MADGITVAGASTAEVTAPEMVAGEPQGLEAAVYQDDVAVREFEAQVATLQRQLEEQAAQIQAAEEARKRAEAEALRQEAIYRGYQKETTSKLQERARLLAEKQERDKLEGRLNKIEKLLEFTAQRTMDPEEAERFKAALELESLKAERDALLARQNQPQAESIVEEPNVIDLEARKRELLSRYYPTEQLDLSDPRINWAEDVRRYPTYEAWEAAFTSSVDRIINESRTVNERELAMREAEELRRQAAEEAARLRSEAAAEAERLRAEAAEAARIEREERLRALGADVNPTAVPEGISIQQSLEQMFPVDERWLASGNPADRARFEEAMRQRQVAMRQALADARSRRR